MQNLLSNVVEGEAFCGFCGCMCGGMLKGMRGGTRSRDDSPHIKSLNLIRLGKGGFLKDIRLPKMRSHPKFIEITQVKTL